VGAKSIEIRGNDGSTADEKLDEAIQTARKRLEYDIDKGRVSDAEECDNRAAEIAVEIMDEYGYQRDSEEGEAVMSSMMDKAGEEFPGEY
jgi:hypothetical protein